MSPSAHSWVCGAWQDFSRFRELGARNVGMMTDLSSLSQASFVAGRLWRQSSALGKFNTQRPNGYSSIKSQLIRCDNRAEGRRMEEAIVDCIGGRSRCDKELNILSYFDLSCTLFAYNSIGRVIVSPFLSLLSFCCSTTPQQSRRYSV